MQALTVLEFVIKRGSDQCVENSRVLLSKLEDLQVFEYTSPDGRDHGVNVRHRYVPTESLLHVYNRRDSRYMCRLAQLGLTFAMQLCFMKYVSYRTKSCRKPKQVIACLHDKYSMAIA